MTLGSREHSEMMKNFENNYLSVFGSARFDKEKELAVQRMGHIYQDGKVNEAFRLWCLGYSAGRVAYM